MPAASKSPTAPIKRRFAIMAASRSGSNMLCTMLDSHPGILCHHEIYNPKGIRLALPLRDTDFTLGTTAERDRDPEAFLERVWAAPLGAECVGFKFTHRQNEAIYRRLLADTDIAKIILRRRNRVKTWVSQKVSEALSQWEVYHQGDLAPKRPKVEVDPAAFLERVAFDKAYYAEIREAMKGGGHAWIEVCYEDLFSAPTQAALVRFLGPEPLAGGMKVRSVKQNPRDLRDLIANYDELCACFAGTEFEEELKDQGN